MHFLKIIYMKKINYIQKINYFLFPPSLITGHCVTVSIGHRGSGTVSRAGERAVCVRKDMEYLSCRAGAARAHMKLRNGKIVQEVLKY